MAVPDIWPVILMRAHHGLHIVAYAHINMDHKLQQLLLYYYITRYVHNYYYSYMKYIANT